MPQSAISKSFGFKIVLQAAPNTTCSRRLGVCAIYKHFPASGFFCFQAESTPTTRRELLYNFFIVKDVGL
jgi:hypothetical protein